MGPFILEGMHGSDKGYFADALARAHKKNYISTDVVVEKNLQMTIAQIYEKFGVPYFKEKEKEVVLSLCRDNNLDNTIISLGATAVLSPQLRDVLQNTGKIVYIKASPETIYERLVGMPYSERAAHNSQIDINKIRSAYIVQNKFYEMCATDILNIDGRDNTDIFIALNSIYTNSIKENVRVVINIDK